MRRLVCGRRGPYAWRMGKATAAMQGGLLVMLALISGISALECHLTGSYAYKGDKLSTSTQAPHYVKTITCPKGENACMEAQVILSTGESVDSVIDRGCAKNERIYGAASNWGDPHFGVKYEVRYCFTDLCNNEMNTDIPWNLRNDTAPEESGSNQCYSGLRYWSRRRVTCRKGYSQCYKGNIFIRAGRYGLHAEIQTCRMPDCDAPKNVTFGPVEFGQWGSCCQGSFCNESKSAPPTSPPTNSTKLDAEKGKESEPPTAGIGH